MILLACLVVCLLSFTPVPTWALLVLVLIPPIVVTVAMHDAMLLKSVVLALIAGVILYAPLAWAASWFGRAGFWISVRRFRFVYFFLSTVLAAGIVFNLVQLTV